MLRRDKLHGSVSDRTKSTNKTSNFVVLKKMISFNSIRNVQPYRLFQVNGLHRKEDSDWLDFSSSYNYR